MLIQQRDIDVLEERQRIISDLNFAFETGDKYILFDTARELGVWEELIPVSDETWQQLEKRLVQEGHYQQRQLDHGKAKLREALVFIQDALIKFDKPAQSKARQITGGAIVNAKTR